MAAKLLDSSTRQNLALEHSEKLSTIADTFAQRKEKHIGLLRERMRSRKEERINKLKERQASEREKVRT